MACSDPRRSSCWCCSYAVVVAVDVAAAAPIRCSVLLGEVVAVVAIPIIGGVGSLVAIVDVIISVVAIAAAAAAIVVVVWRSAAVLFGL